jgi:sigma-B regulation protein RsbU (phosphoserine phosphatase)
MTAMCVALDAERGRASVVGAGHPPLVVIRAAGAAELIASSAPPLGLLERSQFEESVIDLERGDGFFLYTDGLCGPSQKEGKPWTPERLRTLLTDEQGSAHELLQTVLERIAPGEEVPLADDLAALVVRRTDF